MKFRIINNTNRMMKKVKQSHIKSIQCLAKKNKKKNNNLMLSNIWKREIIGKGKNVDVSRKNEEEEEEEKEVMG